MPSGCVATPCSCWTWYSRFGGRFQAWAPVSYRYCCNNRLRRAALKWGVTNGISFLQTRDLILCQKR